MAVFVGKTQPFTSILLEIEDAQKIRRVVIDCFEKAVLLSLTDEERRTNLPFVVVGGGPTGVEFAAELHDHFQEDLVNLYPSVKDFVKITAIQSGDHILNTSASLEKDLEWFKEQVYTIPEPSSPGRTYSEYLVELPQKDPQAFICHFYNIYVAYSAGG
ncbi:External alternative NAD(P)H-ubiquinone oxidoreductase B1, mitochondrial [Stylosanthes scabra]|uniref:External alternative NAD(P)H-ubiquinone oxidoreductase B1, mitochondrial n=1 Tax=Stylosanthes scabra TaxID=79078 RepID=A0ABU6XQT1_9FABA|nr:External alternative NAD(P)H-ubiquinone oxidoreductase B1, mitochondrial [Stylosanthes scabra]